MIATILVALGIPATLRMLIEARRDRRRIEAAGVNGELIEAAQQGIRREWFRLTKHVITTAFVASYCYQYWDDDNAPQRWLTLSRTVAVITIGMLLTLNSVLDNRAMKRRLKREGVPTKE